MSEATITSAGAGGKQKALSQRLLDSIKQLGNKVPHPVIMFLYLIAADDELPLVVAGVERLRAFFNEVTSHGSDIIATVAGSYDSTPTPELAQLVWPPVRDAQAFEELEAAVSARRYASGIQQVWPMAVEGRGQTAGRARFSPSGSGGRQWPALVAGRRRTRPGGAG